MSLSFPPSTNLTKQPVSATINEPLMRSIFASLVLLLFVHVARSQFLPPDSLRHLWQTELKEDTTRVKRFLYYANSMLYTHPDSMMLFSDRALALSEKLDWPSGIARASQLKGVAYQFIENDFPNALAYLYKSIEANKRAKIPSLDIDAYANIGNIFYAQKQYNKSLEYFRRAEAMMGASNNNKRAQLLVNIANTYFDKKVNDTAKLYFQRGLQLAEQQGNALIASAAMNSIAYLYYDSRNYDSALLYTNRSLAISNQSGNVLVKANSLVNLALIYLHTNRLTEAKATGEEALTMAKKAGSSQFERQAWEGLATIYAALNDYKHAYEASNRYSRLNDSLLSDDSKQEVIRIEMQAEQDKKDALNNAAHDAQVARQAAKRDFWLGMAGLVFVAALLLFYFYKKRRDAEARTREAELNVQIADTEMKVMRLQMNPHFLFNSLNSIGNYLSKNDPHSAEKYLTRFAKLMRMTLENSEQSSIPLADDLAALQLYMELEESRLQKKFHFAIDVDPGIDQQNTLVPPLIFQPFVENSIWHGIASKDGGGAIKISITKMDGMLHCVIDDNGVGREKAALLQQAMPLKQSLGMKITRARIDILNKLKGSNASVQLVDKPQGLTAELNLPLDEKF